MKIIDTNAVNYILANNIRVQEIYYLAPDVREESEITEVVFGRKLSSNVKDITSHPMFDNSVYLRNYKDMLNRHSGRSFYNMTGFGDISILALISTLKTALQSLPVTLFREMEEPLAVITEDGPLIQKIEREFNSTTNTQKVAILSNQSIS